MVEAKRKKGETFESFVRRFNKRLIQSGKILQFKKIRFHVSDRSRNMIKASKLYGMKTKDRLEYLKKSGRLKEDERKKYRR
ncbi:hypothetical protein COT97_02100 [Candidatus Falkowbacteria bacterium CG10_big_fil_rev_8_21_14_0_10_39_11]|uniref:30S ribosomal protein S21 n=1 Tax=Candidatus Falkowbacteria bacterium CG10_big_fil_rev_8_21_14_0_10_39_11 TaxID=1974565 RepID=A0A2H0V5B9_9BACT|nr:MAG: hypothetical protein COT97_02100 [Candidatus Falkowbacteria bacterium CG10_big_fil_rev_8_21_14_0_10_39_11]